MAMNHNWLFRALRLTFVVTGVANQDVASIAVAADALASLSATKFLLQRMIGCLMVTVRADGTTPVFGGLGILGVGLLRTPTLVAPLIMHQAPTDVQAADQSWVYREFRQLSWQSPFGSPPAQAVVQYPLTGYHAHISDANPSIHGGLAVTTSVNDPWPVDWQMRGGAGTNLNKDVSLMLAASWLPTTGQAEYTGVDWTVEVTFGGAVLAGVPQ